MTVLAVYFSSFNQLREIKEISSTLEQDFFCICGCCAELKRASEWQESHQFRNYRLTLPHQLRVFAAVKRLISSLKDSDNVVLLVFQDVGRLENIVIRMFRSHLNSKIVLMPDGLVHFNSVYKDRFFSYLLIHRLCSLITRIRVPRSRQWLESTPDLVLWSPIQEIPIKYRLLNITILERPTRIKLFSLKYDRSDKPIVTAFGTILKEIGSKNENQDLESFLKSVRSVSNSLGIHSIIYRPHPRDKMEIHQHLKAFGFMMSSESLSDDLIDSFAIVTFPSTIILEALNLSKRVFVYMPSWINFDFESFGLEISPTKIENLYKCTYSPNFESKSNIVNAPNFYKTTLYNSLFAK